jgi:hypothetical protein
MVASIALWALAGLLGLRMLGTSLRDAGRPSHGFVTYYTTSRLILEGAPVARFYDDAWFSTQVARFEPTVYDIHIANVPTMGLLTLPLALLPYRTARVVWTLASLCAAVALMLWVGTIAGVTGMAWPALYTVTFLFQPLRENLFRGQLYVWVLAACVLAWQGSRTNRPWLLGASLGALLITKPAALMLWPLLLVQRRWRALLWGIGVAGGIALLSLPRIGTEAWITFLQSAAALRSRPMLSLTAYQSFTSLARQLFLYHPTTNPAPLADWPSLAHGLALLLVVGCLAASVAVAARRKSNDAVFAAFVLLSLMCSPVSIDYHYTTTLLPIALLLAILPGTRWSTGTQLLVLGSLLIAADLPYRSPRLTHGLLALFAYPKLYGAVLLWALCLWLALAGSSSSLPRPEGPARSKLPRRMGGAADPAV